MTYLKESWYVAGFAEEITRTPLRNPNENEPGPAVELASIERKA